MTRNKEIQVYIVAVCSISLISTIIAGFFSFHSAIFVLSASILLLVANLIFTRLRYREIQRLSGYLREISNGNYSLDVRDNHEGELSILKNEIYKVTNKLSEHSIYLQNDKVQLTDAISDISHQLKTPLTSMMVMADLLSDANLPTEKRTEFTRNIRIQLERIEWLVSSLLKLSKIDAKTIQFKKDHLLVKDLIDKALEPVLIPMDIKQHSVLIEGDDDVSLTGDLNWTVEALINILKNCVEHTPESGHISIAYFENALYTKIVISDSGKGIPKEDLTYIFKRFYKGKNASDESVGIGLAMAHSIITNQNGDIEVYSELHKGTQFHIKFYKKTY